MGIVAVNTPRRKYALGVPILSWSTDMIHHLVSPTLLDSRANALGDVAQRIIPRHLRPTPCSPFADTFQGVKNPVGVVDLIESRGSFRAVASARRGMLWVALKFAD